MDIKMNIKRAYCPDCGVLVDLHEKKSGESLRMTCCRCDRPIWAKDGINWRFVKKPAALEAQPESKEIKVAVKEDTRRETRPSQAGEARQGGRRPREAREPRGEGRPPRSTRPPREGRPPRTEGRSAPRAESKAEPKAEVKSPPKEEAKK